MDALKDGIPKGVKATVLASSDESLRLIHRISSVHPLTRRIMEFIQSGLPQIIFAFGYRIYLRSNVKGVRENLRELIKDKQAKKLLIVATHFGFAHQVAAVKKGLEKQTGCKIYLVVHVTDDSPQFIWYIDGADLLMVTSEYVRKGLLEYGRRRHFPPTKIEINPCPLNPSLLVPLTGEEMANKRAQADAGSGVPIEVLVPISGAAVGTEYVTDLMARLHQKSNRFVFQVVTKIAPYTKKFLTELEGKDYIKVYASDDDKKVVDLYQEVIRKNTVLLEITKPSEQAFKAVLPPTSQGGVMMMFTQPVGRQEYENLYYLIRRKLVPTLQESSKLWEEVEEGKEYAAGSTPNLEAGIKMPFGSKTGAEFIWWCLNNGIFTEMLQSDRSAKKKAFPNEINGEGAKLFWEKTAEFIAR
jgi:hypothetical protein